METITKHLYLCQRFREFCDQRGRSYSRFKIRNKDGRKVFRCIGNDKVFTIRKAPKRYSKFKCFILNALQH